QRQQQIERDLVSRRGGGDREEQRPRQRNGDERVGRNRERVHARQPRERRGGERITFHRPSRRRQPAPSLVTAHTVMVGGPSGRNFRHLVLVAVAPDRDDARRVRRLGFDL